MVNDFFKNQTLLYECVMTAWKRVCVCVNTWSRNKNTILKWKTTHKIRMNFLTHSQFLDRERKQSVRMKMISYHATMLYEYGRLMYVCARRSTPSTVYFYKGTFSKLSSRVEYVRLNSNRTRNQWAKKNTTAKQRQLFSEGKATKTFQKYT